MARVSGLARSFDLRYSSNRYIFLVGAAAAAVAFSIADDDPLRAGVTVGGAAFFGWAIAREIDPDRNLSAAIAAPVAAALAWLFGNAGNHTSLGTLYLLLVAARVVVRSTGVVPTRVDLGLHLLISGWLATGPHAWLAALVLAVSVVRDTRLSDPAPAENLWWGAAIGVTATAMAGVLSTPGDWVAPTGNAAALVVAGLVAGAVVVRPEPVRSTTDQRNLPIDPLRVASARLTTVVGAALVAAVGGAAGVGAVVPAWVALAAAAAVRLARPGIAPPPGPS